MAALAVAIAKPRVIAGGFGKAPEPPPEMPEAQKKIWRDTIAGEPAIRHAGKTTPRCSFSNMNYQLAYGVWRLARSLGLKATLKSRHAMLYGKNCGLCWYVSFTAKASDQVFRLARKQKLLPLNKGARSGTLVVISCDSVETVPTKCISVDAPDRLFLAGHGCVPTHNSMEAACIILLHLCGPEAKSRVNSQLYSTALSRDQAALVFGLAAKMVRMHPDLRQVVAVRETAKQLACPRLGTVYRALSADAGTNFGLSPALVIHDELGQVKGPRSSLHLP